MNGDERGKRLVVLTGAGMSAESGLKTFRDAGGLWEEYDVMECTIVEDKLVDLNCFDIKAAMKMVAGTARSMGIVIKGDFPE